MVNGKTPKTKARELGPYPVTRLLLPPLCAPLESIDSVLKRHNHLRRLRAPPIQTAAFQCVGVPSSLFMNGSLTTASPRKMKSWAAIPVPGKSLRLCRYCNWVSSIASLHEPVTVGTEPADISSQLFTILSRPNWQKHPSLKNLIPSITPFHVSSIFNLNLNPQTALGFFNWIARKPGFKHNVHSYASLLNILVCNKQLRVAESVRFSMIKYCDSVEDVNFALEFLRRLNKNDNEEFKFNLTLKCYNMLLMTLARFILVDEMKSLYQEMLQDLVSPNIYTWNTMVNGYCKLGNMVEADLYVNKILQAGLSPDTFTYTSLILGHCRNKDIESAYKIFKIMPHKGCRRNEVSYTNLIHGLCEVGQVDEALRLFSQMGEDSCSPTVRTYTVLIFALCGLGRKLEAMKLFKEMNESGCVPNVHTYTVLIDCFCKEGNLDEARKLLDEMMKKGLVPTVVTYNALIDGYCKLGKTDAGLKLLGLMESNNCSPNARTYNELIFGFCKVKDIHRAMSLLSKMFHRKLSPTLVTYNSLIQGQCRGGHLDSAYKLLNLMTENGLIPDQWTYCILVDTLCKRGRVEEAHGLFSSLKEKDLKANEVIYTALVDGYCKVGKIDDAHSLFKRMLAEECLPNSITYNVLMDSLCKEKKVKEAMSLVDEMVKMNVKVTVETYTILIEEMLKEGNFSCADRFLNLMISSGCQPDVFTYTTFVHSYCSQGRLKEAEDMMTKMKKEGIFPDSLTYTLLIDAYGRMQLIDCAFGVLKRMFDAGCEPSHHTYAFLLKHLAKGIGMKNVRHAFASYLDAIDTANVWKIIDFEITSLLFERMIEHGCAPNTITYSKLIIGFCKAGRLYLALKLLNHMQEGGIPPSEDIYNSLLSCCLELKMYGEAMRILGAMVEDGHLAHLESCKLLISGLCDEGSSDKAESVFCILLRCEYNHDEVAWKVLIDGLLKSGFVDECSKFLSLMEKKGCQIHPQTYAMLIEGLDGT